MPPDALRTPVVKVMTRNVICIRSDLTINELIMTLFENGISGAPVVDARGKPLGVAANASRDDDLHAGFARRPCHGQEMRDEEPVLRHQI